MKRKSLLLFLIAQLCAIASWATTIGGINYSLNSTTKEATVIALLSGTYSGDVVIPATVVNNGVTYSVTIIGSSAFKDCSNLTSVTLPSSLTEVGSYAFAGCSSLTTVIANMEYPPTITTDVFPSQLKTSGTLKVPGGTQYTYIHMRWIDYFKTLNSVPKYISNLSELSNNKRYLITTKNDARGDLSVANGTLATTNEGAKNYTYYTPYYSHFAIVQFNGDYYLYSVQDEMFISNTGAEIDFPTTKDAILPYKRGNYFIIDFKSTGYTLNVNSNPGIAINSWGTLNYNQSQSETYFDDGNQFSIEDCGYFDPTKALAKLNTTLYANTLQTAKNALSANLYSVITGDERTELEQAVEQYSNIWDVREPTVEAYKEVISALEAAITTFKDAKSGYDTWQAAKDLAAKYEYLPYASINEKAAAEAALTAVPKTADDAVSLADSLLIAYRQYAESSAVLEGVEGSVDVTGTYIQNPKVVDASLWATVLGSGSGGSLVVKKTECWTDGSGSTSHSFFDGGNWNATSWDISKQQEITLPAGRYQLTAMGRSSQDVTLTLFAGDATAEMAHIGATGGLFNNGWEQTSVEFELMEPATISIGVRGVTSSIYQWMSFSDFRLVRFPTRATGVSLDSAIGSIHGKGQTLQLTATVSPSDTYDKSVTWASSDENVATVDSMGLVTAVSYGTALITVTTTDGSNKSDTCAVTVILPIEKLVEGKTFTLNCVRGYIYGDESHIKGYDDAELASEFAIVTYKGTNYLYDATNKAFAVHTSATLAGYSDNPALESSSDFSKAVTGLTWGRTNNEAYPYYLEDIFGNWMNLNSGHNVVINTWKTLDDGNRFAVKIVDTDFDASEAIAMLDSYFSTQTEHLYMDLNMVDQIPTNYQGWTNATGYAATQFAPTVQTNDGQTVQLCERYDATTAPMGQVLKRTLTGLENGIYRIELYGAASSTKGRDASLVTDMTESDANDSTAVYLYAKTSVGTIMQFIPVQWGTSLTGSRISNVVLNAVEVTNGTVEIGIYCKKKYTNWHVIQIKGLTLIADCEETYSINLQQAQEALSDSKYSIVTGVERTSLEQAVEQYSNIWDVREPTVEAYKEVISALEAAITTFKDAKSGYDTWQAAKDLAAKYENLPYASSEKKAAAEATLAAVPETAADAVRCADSLLIAYRKSAESNAMLEGVEGAEDVTTLYIQNPKAEDALDATIWQTVLGVSSGGSITYRSDQPWTDADGVASHRYFDGGNWGAYSWDVTLQQFISLPAGHYQLSAMGRSSQDVTLTLFAGDATAEMAHINAEGGLFNLGWEQTSVEFELMEPATINIGVRGVASSIHQWMSFSDFRLVRFPTRATGVSLDSAIGSIHGKGQTLQLTATVSPSDTYDKSVTWASSDENVATVDSTGLVTAHVNGTALIIVTTTDGSNKSDTCAVTVTLPIEELVEGRTFTLECARGYIGGDGSYIKGYDDVAQASEFAIVTYQGTNYLYDATNKAFAVHTISTPAGLHNNPTLESSSDFSKAVTGLTWGRTNNETYPYYLEDIFGNWMNLNSAHNVLINTWKTLDDGNRFAVKIVDTDFDASEAIAMLDNYYFELFQAAKNLTADRSYPYADNNKKTAAETAATATPASAAEARSMAEALLTAYRQYAESSAVLEGVEGSVDVTGTYIQNPKAEDALDATIWQTVFGVSSGGSISFRDDQPWTDGDGVTSRRYFDGGNWSYSYWDVSLQQSISLPAGHYQLTAMGRSSQDVTLTLFAGDATAEMAHINDEGGLFNNGWEQTSVEFELMEPATISIGVRGVTSSIYQWMSFSDFRLAQFFVPVSGITLNQTETTLTNVGDTLKLIATVAPLNATNKSLTWTSSDENVAVVDENGLVTALSSGTATITVQNGEQTATCEVTVDEGIAVGIRSIDNGELSEDNYLLNGVKQNKRQRGINIIRTIDGKVRKVIVK